MKQQHAFFAFVFFFFSLSLVAHECFFTSGMSSQKITQLCDQFMPENLKISQIVFKADIPVERYELQHLISFKEQDIVCAEQIKQSVCALFKKNKFSDVSVSKKHCPDGNHIVFSLTSHWTLDRCVVAGMIRGKVKYRFLYDLQHGEIFTEKKHTDALAHLEKSLCADGYFNHDVSARLMYDTKNKTVNVHLFIKLGQRFYIERIDLCVTSSVCSQAALLLQKKIYKQLCQEQDSYFSADVMQKIETEIKKLIKQEGFFWASIKTDTRINSDKKTVALSAFVDLGTSKQLMVSGNVFFTHEQIVQIISPTGSLVPLFSVTIIAQDLKELYKKNGFLFAHIDAHETEETVVITIQEGTRSSEQECQEQEKKVVEKKQEEHKSKKVLCFGNTIVRGQLEVPFKYVERELCYKKGDAWNQDLLQESLVRLRNLGIFEHVYIHPDLSSYNTQASSGIALAVPEIKDIFIDVEPASRFELLLRGGVGLQQSNKWCWFGQGAPYAAGGSFMVRNISGHADSLLINADSARGCQAYSAAYTVPWLWNSPINTTIKGYGSHVDQPAFTLEGVQLYQAYKGGILLSLQRHFETVDCHFNTGCEWLALRSDCQGTHFEQCAISIARAYDIDPCMLGLRIPYFFIEPSLVFMYEQDLVENGDVQPLTFLTAKLVIPFGQAPAQAYFLRLLAEQSFFVPIGKMMGALRARLGHIVTPCFARVNPLERFYAGGVNSVRSYETDMCPPYGLFYDDTGCCRFVPQGAQSIAMLSAELRAPLFGPLGAVLFQDVGVLKSQQQWKLENNLVLGTGLGLRYQTPIGILSFDIGWKWWRQPDESCYAWFLSLGNAF